MKKALTLLTALVLALTLLAGCGGKTDSTPQSAEPAPVQDETKNDPAPTQPADSTATPAPQPEEQKPEDTQPTDTTQPEEAAPADSQPTDDQTKATQPEEQPAEAPTEPATEPVTEPATEPVTEPATEPEPSVPEDGTYTVSVTLEGGSGRATVESPAVLRCEGGQFWATIVWSSPNFDYMKVNGEKYLQTNTEGNSTFEIPVAAFDQKLDVIADTVAMSEPHEVEYTLYFDSTSLTKQ